MRLNRVIPFGRRLDEYRHLFNLGDADLNRRILSVADGPASFNAEMTALGKQVISIDPVYALPGAEIERRFNEVVDDIIAQMRATPGDWVWGYHRSADDVRTSRTSAMQFFIADFENGKTNGRYISADLPSLPFANDNFDLALCANFLFLYSDHLDEDFHLASLREMLRLAPEARIFPLITLMLNPSPYLQPVIERLRADGYTCNIELVDFELQRGGNQMLRVRRPQ